jgi:hypothetical protein
MNCLWCGHRCTTPVGTPESSIMFVGHDVPIAAASGVRIGRNTCGSCRVRMSPAKVLPSDKRVLHPTFIAYSPWRTTLPAHASRDALKSLLVRRFMPGEAAGIVKGVMQAPRDVESVRHQGPPVSVPEQLIPGRRSKKRSASRAIASAVRVLLIELPEVPRRTIASARFRTPIA